ncbi:MAG: sulfite exporter TauE/SafE family protein [Phycisphaerales bacterium]|nr:sulfite exporter TauE/SafE family protein [Phycisphaerales bacterium]
MSPAEIAIAAAIGLVAGLLGGLCGIGGSIVMLPALGLLFGYDDEQRTRHHLYMASAMLVNVVVAFVALRQHTRAGAVRGELVRLILPAMAVAVVAGVLSSNAFPGTVPKLALVAFIFAFTLYTLFTTVRSIPDPPPPEAQRCSPALFAAIGLVTGFLAGFLAIGGGIVLVPLLQIAARVPLRNAIATSAAVMWLTASSARRSNSPRCPGSACRPRPPSPSPARWRSALSSARPSAHA